MEVVRHYLSEIEKSKHLNAFVHVFADEAIQKASALDKKRKTGNPIGKLHGVVIAIKDVICYKDYPLTAAFGILKNFTSLYSATADTPDEPPGTRVSYIAFNTFP